MRVWWLGMILGLLLLGGGTGLANVDIQYMLPPIDCATSGCFITGVSDIAFDSVEGHGLVTLIGATAAQIVWPVPAGCPVGDPAWSRVMNPEDVTVGGSGLALRPGLILFSTTSPLLTGCHQVTSWRQLRTLMNEAIVTSVPDAGVVGALNYHFDWYDARCRGAETNANCVEWKGHLDNMVTAYPGRQQGITAAAAVDTLVTEVRAFKAAQCTAVPGGPFC